ncbi:hypothetical protein JXR93_06695 [bacterium]|nr:hypothetical protein [bacterium]
MKNIIFFIIIIFLPSCFYTPETSNIDETTIFTTSLIQNRFNNTTATTFSIAFPTDYRPFEEMKIDHCQIKTYLAKDSVINADDYPNLGDFKLIVGGNSYFLNYLDFYETQGVMFIDDYSKVEIFKSISEISEYDNFFIEFPRKIEFKNGFPEKIEVPESGWITELKENYPLFKTEMTIFYEENGVEYVKTLSCNYTNSRVIVISPEQRATFPTSDYWGYISIINEKKVDLDKNSRIFQYRFQNNETIPIEIK